ncbi:O-antigen ligase family protein [uncultured Bradyrhizobium sp.]|uniref:O-antigen ligase family protein n=1 Tax=uncultured Bradyrhizobium sp. TaxID=199684 RepID=UPI0035C9A9F3
MSIAAASEIRTVFDRLRRLEVMDVLRAATFIATLLLVWVSLRPFVDLSGSQLKDLTTGNETLTYAAFGCLAVLTVALAMADNRSGLTTLLSPGFILFGAWVFVTAALSLDLSTSIRRFALTASVTAVASTLLLLPKSQTELMRWLSIAALALLAICYLGILLAPNLSIHLATDAQEPALAGDWRGSFGHKNGAAPVMVFLLFIGIYAVRLGALLSGTAIIGFAGLFLLFSGGKSALALSIAVFLLAGLVSAARTLWLRAAICLTPLLALNLLSVGTVMSDGLENIARMLPFDTTFTGRTDIWTFAFQALQQRLLTGYGFAAFWGSSSIKDLPEGKEWAEFASHSHNGYLDTALAMGLPGLLLLIVVLVAGPLKNFHAADRGGNSGPLATMLLQIWLFGLYLSSMESFFLDRADPLWFTFLLGVFGLHYLARFRLSE